MLKLKNHEAVLEALTEQLIEFQCDFNGYQTDVYLYVEEGNGTIDTFLNVSGNSWLEDEHFTIYTDDGDKRNYSKMDDLSDGGNSFSWLIRELESKFGLSGIEEKAYAEITAAMDEETLEDDEIACFDDLAYYDVEHWLESRYSDEIDQYYAEDFIPNFCMDSISEAAYNALYDFENDYSYVVLNDGELHSEYSNYDEAVKAAEELGEDALVDIWNDYDIEKVKNCG